MPIQNLGVINRPYYVKNFSNNLKKMNEEEQRFYLESRKYLGEYFFQGLPVEHFSFTSQRDQLYPYNPVNQLSSVEHALNIQRGTGSISVFDLETFGMFKGGKNQNVTPFEQQLQSISELSIVQDLFDKGEKAGRNIHNFAFGISPSQKAAYEELIMKFQTVGAENLTSIESSTLERLARYGVDGAIEFNSLTQLYEVKKIGESSIADLDKIIKGFQKSLEVGAHQGIQTQRGKVEMVKAMRLLQSSDVVSGYNINVFDIPFLNSTLNQMGLSSLNFKKNQVLDGLEVLRTTNGHDIKGWVQKLAQRSGIKHFNPGKNPGRLETIARAMGLNSMDHLAEADNISLFEFMFYQPRFGSKGNESFLESSRGTLKTHSKAFQQLPTLNHDNRGQTVIYANQSLYIPSQRFDFQQINGESQTHIDYAINRGEYYHLKDFRYLSRDEIAKIKDKQVAQGILDNLGTSNGLYMMKLGGASKYNEGKESVIFRNTLEDFEDVFKKFSLFNLVDGESQAGVGFDSVTQKMIDKQTKVTVHDKLRREITGYFSEGDRQYKSMRNMYLTFDAVEESFKTNGYQMTKSNVHKLIQDKLPGIKKEEIFNPIFTNSKVKTTPQQRYQAFEEMFSFIKSSRTTMGTVFNTIESNINPSSLKTLFHTQSPLGNSSMDSFVDVMRTKALGSFMNHFEMKSSTSSPRTMRDAFNLVLPKFDSTGKMLDETIQVNFFDVNSATSSLTNLVSGGRYQKTVGAEQTFKVGEVKQVLSYLSERGFISKKYVDEVYNNTNAYDVMKKVAYDIHHSFNNLYKEMGFGNVDLNSEEFQVNAMMEMLNQKQEKTFSSFGEGVYQQWMQHPDERWNLNVFSVALKDGVNKTQQKARGFDSYVKRNHLDIQSMVLDSIQQAKQSNVKVLDRSPKSFDTMRRILRKDYGYTEENVESLMDVLYGRRSPKDGERLGGGLLSKNGERSGMMVQLVDNDGQLNLVATTEEKAGLVNRMLYRSQQEKTLDPNLKNHALVLNLPQYEKNHPGRVFKTGTVYKVSETHLKPRLVGRADDLTPASQRVVLTLQDTIDEALSGLMGVRKVMDEHIVNGNFLVANQIAQNTLNKPIMKASSYTGRQTIMKDGRLTTAVIPNTKDLLAEETIGMGYIRSLLPFLYEKDEVVRGRVNQILSDQKGWNVSQVQKRIEQEVENMKKYKFKSFEDGDLGVALKEYFTVNLIHGDGLINRILNHSLDLPIETVQTLQGILEEPINQIMSEKNVQQFRISKINQPSLVPYGVTNDLSRATINQSLTYLHYNLNDITDVQREKAEQLGVYMGDRIATREGLNVKSKLMNYEQYRDYENSLYGGMKVMSTSDIKREVHKLKGQRKELAKKFSVEESVVDDVLGAFDMISTYEGGGVLHPTVKKTFFNYPELLSFKVSNSQMNEEEIDRLIGQVISKDGRVNVGGKHLRLDYDKKVAGKVVSREGHTLFVEALDRNIHETKISFAGVEKMMLQDPSSFLLNPSGDALSVMDNLWESTFGKVAIVANPELLKHESSGGIVGSYINQAFMYLQQNNATKDEKDMFLSILNKHLPSWNFSIEPNLRGDMSLLMSGMPNVETGNIEGIERALMDMKHYADHQRSVGGGTFVGMMDDLKKAQDENIYYSTFQRLTNSESPGMAVKHQARANQVMTAKRVIDYEGNVIPLTYKDASGKTRHYAEDIIDYEKGTLKETKRYQKGKKMLGSIQTAFAGMQGKAEDYGVKGHILEVNADDLPILPRGVSAENIGDDFYNSVAGITDDIKAFKVNLENFDIVNPITKEKESFIHIPRLNTENIDGHVMMSEAQKRVNDLLQAVDLLKNKNSDKTTEGLLEAIQTAYDTLVGSFYNEYFGDDGIMKGMLLEGHMPFSTRALGAQIVAPVTPELMLAKTMEEKRQVLQAHLKDLKENQGRNIHFVDPLMENYVRGTNSKGEMILRDVAEVSERQLIDMGIDFVDVGKQVMEDNRLNGGEFKQRLIGEGVLTPDGNYLTSTKEVDDLSVYEQRLREKIARKTGKGVEDIILTPKQLEQAKRQRGRALSKLKQIQTEEEIDFYASIGRRYMEEVGHLGTIIRDPAFQDGAKNIALYKLNPRMKGKVVRITSASSGRMKQDVDGDTDGLQLFLEKAGVERSVDEYGIPFVRTKTRLLNDDSVVIQSAKKIQEGEALTNAAVHFAGALETELMDGKGSPREEGQALFEDISIYREKLKKTRHNEEGELVDNLMQNEQLQMRGVKNRQNKEAIGYLSNPNHLIRDIANVVYEGDEYVSERGTLSIFTQIAEQDLISVKHVKDAATELTPVEKFNRGIQSLMSYNQDERNEGIGYVLESLKGSIFKNNFLPTVEDIVTKTNRAVEERDRVLTEGVMLLSDLMNTDEARSIYNSKYIKGRDSLSNEQKIEALKQGMGNVSSPLLEERRQTLNEGIGIFTDESGNSIKDHIFSYSGNKDRQTYSTDFYKIKTNGVSSTQRPFIEMESLTDGSIIQLRGETKEVVASELNSSFVGIEGPVTEELQRQLQTDFERNFQSRGLKDYDSFVAHRLEASLADVTEKFRLGELTEAQYRRTAIQAVSSYVDEEFSFDYAEKILNRLQSRNSLELKGLKHLSESFYETEAGSSVESFARTATHLQRTGVANASETASMIRQMNEAIRQGVKPTQAKIFSIYTNTSQGMDLVPGQLKKMEMEATRNVGVSYSLGEHSGLEMAKSLQETYQVYDVEKGGQRFLSNLKTKASEVMEQSGIQNKDIIEASVQKTYETFIKNLHTMNGMARESLQSMIDNNSSNPELFGWIDTESVTKNLSNFNELELNQTLKTLEHSVVGYGSYAGANIGQLSLEQLKATLNEVRGGAITEAQRQTEAHVSTYLNVVDQLGDNGIVSAIETRHFEFQRRALSDSMLEDGIKSLNENIRSRVAELSSQQQVKPSSMQAIHDTLSSIKSNWTTKRSVATMAGAAITMGVVGVLSGKQFTATPKVLDAKRQAKEEYQHQTESPASQQWQESAPQSQPSTYLMEEQPLNYQIKARTNGRYSSKDYASFITRTLKPNQTTITTTDNREELNEHWLTNQLNELL